MDLIKLNNNCKTCLNLLDKGKNEMESGLILLADIVQKKEKSQVQELLVKYELKEKIDSIIEKVESSQYKLVIHNEQMALRLKQDIRPIKVYSLEYYLNKFLNLNEINSENYYVLRVYFTHNQWLTIFSIYDNV